MKTQLSLRMIFLLSILAIGSVMIVTFSVLSAKYFINGLDVSMRESMRSVSKLASPEAGKPIQLNEFTVASRWQDLPKDIQKHLTPLRSNSKNFIQKIIQPTYFRPPSAAYFAMNVEVEGEVRFVSVMLKGAISVMPQSSLSYFKMIFYTCIGALIMFTLILLFVLKRTAIPLRDLVNWAQSLNSTNIQKPVPNFGFTDLNNMAKIIHSSVNSVEEGLQRERQFLSHASHELRTPISVTKSNITLLKRLFEKESIDGKPVDIANRIERATNTMTQLTETLLWLNREESREISTVSLKLSTLIANICEDLQYLVSSKNIHLTVNIDEDESEVVLPETLCRIVLTNLIRNAFQHTQDGTITITQKSTLVTIVNHNEAIKTDQTALGFGFGLAITEKLVSRYGWGYDMQELNGGRSTSINFQRTFI